MQMSNVHERRIPAPVARVGKLLDTLASNDDRFWPHENWSAVKFDRPLQVGATGGHGTGPYTIVAYTPGRHIRFEFGGGRRGYHEFTLQDLGSASCLLRHSTKVQLDIKRAWTWYTFIRPLHNALIEDLLDKVEAQVATLDHPQVWSSRVTRLRRTRGMSTVKTACRPAASVAAGCASARVSDPTTQRSAPI